MSGRCAQRLGHGLGAVRGLGDDLHVGLAVEQQPQAAAHDAVVVGDEQPHRAGSAQSQLDGACPSPGAERTSSAPPASTARSRMPVEPEPGGRRGGVEAACRRR